VLKRVLLLLSCLVFSTTNSVTAIAQGIDPLWQPLAEGIAYRQFFLPGPNRVYVTRLDLFNPNPTIETSLANGVMTGGLQTVLGQAELYDQSISMAPETLGQRYQVIAAINGGFYNTDNGLIAGGMLQSGWYLNRYLDRQSSGGFAWGALRQPFVSECIVQRPGAQLVRLLPGGETIRIDGLNRVADDDQLLVYTPQFGAQTPALKEGLEVLVDLEAPGVLSAGAPVTGTIRLAREDQGGLPIGFDQLVLSAIGAPARAMRPHFKPGVRIALSFDLRMLDGRCQKERALSWDDVRSARAGGDVFLRQGEVQPLSDLGEVLRNPRTAVALNDRYVFFIVVDGRSQLESLGMSMVELALFAKLNLGATWGVAMDGGGSSTMVVNGEVRNNPNADMRLRNRTVKESRTVADGLMMALLQPMERSQRFKPGEAVTISEPGSANLRTGPGTNYPVIQALPFQSRGLTLEHPLNGVLAKGFYWWKISFDNLTGWVSESVIQPES